MDRNREALRVFGGTVRAALAAAEGLTTDQLRCMASAAAASDAAASSGSATAAATSGGGAAAVGSKRQRCDEACGGAGKSEESE